MSQLYNPSADEESEADYEDYDFEEDNAVYGPDGDFPMLDEELPPTTTSTSPTRARNEVTLADIQQRKKPLRKPTRPPPPPPTFPMSSTLKTLVSKMDNPTAKPSEAPVVATVKPSEDPVITTVNPTEAPAVNSATTYRPRTHEDIALVELGEEFDHREVGEGRHIDWKFNFQDHIVTIQRVEKTFTILLLLGGLFLMIGLFVLLKMLLFQAF